MRKSVIILTAGVAVAAGVVAAVLFGPGLLAGGAPGGLTILYPFDGTLFPPDIVAPTFRWADAAGAANAWRATIEFADGGEPMHFHGDGASWRPSETEWKAIQRRSLDRPATVTLFGVDRADVRKVLASGSITLRTSRDEVGAPIFYREVDLPFLKAVNDPSRIRWRFGPISSRQQPPTVLTGLPTCGNCHSFSGDGKVLGMDVDSANDKGSYVICPVSRQMVFDPAKVITWSDYRREDGDKTFGLLAQVSPDGRHAVSMVKDRHVTVGRPELMISQLFFPVKGILAIYDRQTRTIRALPGSDDRRYVHGSPAWSPDGKTICFARAEAVELPFDPNQSQALVDPKAADVFLEGGRTIRYSLYRVPFNDGRGGKCEPIAGASHNGMSNYFPKYSPDGKWIVFCKARSFMLLQPDSELYIVPAAGGKARRMRCNTPRLNSWHSFSPSGRWLVFSSKLNGPYTQLFLTHVDDDGNDTPPVLLEQFTSPEQRRAANIPEFVNAEPDAIVSIREQFLDYYCYYRAGAISLGLSDAALAARHFRRAVELNPKHGDSHFALGFTYRQLGRHDEAIAALARAAALQEDPAEAYCAMGDMQLAKGEVQPAIASLAEAVRRHPDNARYHYNLGVAYLRAGRGDAAVASWETTLGLQADYVEAYINLGAVLARQGRSAKAVAVLTKAVAVRPGSALAHHSLAAVHANTGQFAQAVEHERTALRLARAGGAAALAAKAERALAAYGQGRMPSDR